MPHGSRTHGGLSHGNAVDGCLTSVVPLPDAQRPETVPCERCWGPLVNVPPLTRRASPSAMPPLDPRIPGLLDPGTALRGGP